MSTFDPNNLTLECMSDLGPPPAEPLQTPVTIIDLERGPCVDMHLPMADPCPECGGHNMKVGDWACYGICFRCYDKLMDETR